MQKFFLEMKTKLKFSITTTATSIQPHEVSVLGIVSVHTNFTFVARVNRFSKYNFYKSEDFEIWKKIKKSLIGFTAYHYHYKEKLSDIIIVNTKNENNETLINDWKNYNYVVIVFGRDNKDIIKEVHNSIKENITYGEILSLEEETVSETVNQVMQMDMFSQAQCVKTVKTTKQGLGAETLDNFLVAIEDYLVKVNKR